MLRLHDAPPARPVAGLHRSPRQILLGWPREEPIAALWSAPCAPHARWTIFGEPAGAIRLVATPHGAAWRATGEVPSGVLQGQDAGRHLFAPLETLAPDSGSHLPFRGGWIGWISYDAARRLEPEVLHAARAEPGAWPLAEFWWCPAALLHDARQDHWCLVGEPRRDGPLDRVMFMGPPPAASEFRVGAVSAGADARRAYMSGVRRIVELIHAGDVYQVNLAHRLRAPFAGSVRGLFDSMASEARPWYGALIESPPDDGGTTRAVASISPELFLSFDPPTRRVVTRPMKGTRPAAAGPRDLDASLKDRAELAMIVDLMRNDLGRVCGFGSLRVDEPRVIEGHGIKPRGRTSATRQRGTSGVWQATATVSGVLREGLGVADLLAAAFPAGSVTGAPKIRAMQIIDELEPVARGPYCGAVGFISRCGTARFNVAIRTALIEGKPGPDSPDLADGTIHYHVGAGIVADSLPEAEWRETLDKAWILGALRNRG